MLFFCFVFYSLEGKLYYYVEGSAGGSCTIMGGGGGGGGVHWFGGEASPLGFIPDCQVSVIAAILL